MTSKRAMFVLVITALLGALVFLPARLFEANVNSKIVAFGSLSEVHGTVWSGSGVLNLGTIARAQTRVPLTWQLAPSSLLQARVGFDVVAASATVNGTTRAAFGFATVALSNADLTVDADLIAAFNSIVALAGPGGTLRLKTNDRVAVSYAQPTTVTGKLTARAENFAARTFFPRPIGSYDINITFRESVADYAFADTSGLLKFDGGGQVQWSPRREFAYNGVATPSRDAPLLWTALLPFGRPTLDGRVRIDHKSSW